MVQVTLQFGTEWPELQIFFPSFEIIFQSQFSFVLHLYSYLFFEYIKDVETS